MHFAPYPRLPFCVIIYLNLWNAIVVFSSLSLIKTLCLQAYDQRDEAQGKIAAMKEKNEKDGRNFAEEMKELQRTLDHDEKLKNFLFHKVNSVEG